VFQIGLLLLLNGLEIAGIAQLSIRFRAAPTVNSGLSPINKFDKLADHLEIIVSS
jgi:hypothetical protein